MILLIALGITGFLQDWHLLLPYSRFPHRTEIGKFRIYSDEKISENLEKIVKDAQRRLEWNDWHMKKDTYPLFICHQDSLYQLFAEKAGKKGKSQGFHLQPLGYTFISLEFIQEMSEKNGGKYQLNVLEGNPAHIIAHEMTHLYMAESIGWKRDRRLPSWKKEGYCEYAASGFEKEKDSTYSFKNRIKTYQSGYYKTESSGRQFYIYAEILVEYLIIVKTYDMMEICGYQGDPAELWMEILDWANFE